ncbi:MAG: IS66 family insertion sequence element accessory protein TnpA, partial [Planctomyces sp.]
MAHTVGSVSYLKSERRLERYAQSQLTVNEFCVWEGVSPATFCNWRKKLATGNV